MAQLSTSRTTANTPAEHVADHNILHALNNQINSAGVGASGEIDISAPPSGSGLTALIPNDIAQATANRTALKAIATYCVTNKLVCYAPPGDWYFDWPATTMPNSAKLINITGNFTMRGAGRTLTRFIAPAAHPGYKTCFIFANDGYNFDISDMTLVGPTVWPSPWPSNSNYGKNYDVEAIIVNGMSNSKVRVTRFDTTGIWGSGMWIGSGVASPGQLYLEDCDLTGIGALNVFSDNGGSYWEVYAKNVTLRSVELFNDPTQFTFAISSVVVSGSTITVGTSAPHGLSLGTGQGLYIKGLNANGMTGIPDALYSFTSLPDSTHFVLTLAGVGGAYSGSGATMMQDWWNWPVCCYMHPNVSYKFENVDMIGSYQVAMQHYCGTAQSFTVSSVSISGTTLTIQTSAAHGYKVGGTEVSFNGLRANGITGFADQGRYPVLTVPDTTHFTISAPDAAGTYGSGAKVTVSPARFAVWDGGSIRSHGPGYWGSDIYGTLTQFRNVTIQSEGLSSSNLGAAGVGRAFQVKILSDFEAIGCNFWGEGPALISNNAFNDLRPTHVTLINPNIRLGAHLEGGILITMAAIASQQRQFLKIIGGRAYLDGNGQLIQNSTIAPVDTSIVDLLVEAGPNRPGGSAEVFHQTNGKMSLVRVGFTGDFSGGHLFSFGDANLEELNLDDCDFRQTAGNIFQGPNSSLGNNKVRGRGNKFQTGIVPTWTLASPAAQYFEPRQGVSPTALATVNDLAPNFDYAGYHVAVGSATNINNVYVGGSANTNKCRTGPIMFIADDGNSTFKHNASSTGNLRTTSAADVTLTTGQSIRFVKDDVNNLWLQV